MGFFGGTYFNLHEAAQSADALDPDLRSGMGVITPSSGVSGFQYWMLSSNVDTAGWLS
jgi:hypothetical protein